MPIDYDEGTGAALIKLSAEQAAHKKSVEAYIKKLKDGYFGEEDVRNSGLKKIELQRVLTAQKSARALGVKISSAEAKFKAALLKGYNEAKADHEKALADLKTEYDAELKKHRVSNSMVIGTGPESVLKSVLEKMKQ
jgi:hypothetical protein